MVLVARLENCLNNGRDTQKITFDKIDLGVKVNLNDDIALGEECKQKKEDGRSKNEKISQVIETKSDKLGSKKIVNSGIDVTEDGRLLKILYFNARSIKMKMEELKVMVEEKNLI